MSTSSSTEYEYWTEDADGRGYCSAYSLEDALRGHFHDMKVATNPLGPIVNIKVIKKVTQTTITTESISYTEAYN